MSSLANDYCQEPLQYCKAISLQLIKINGKKNKVKKKKNKATWVSKEHSKGNGGKLSLFQRARSKINLQNSVKTIHVRIEMVLVSE